MEEARHLVGRHVPLGQRGLEIGNIVDLDGPHDVGAVLRHFGAEFRPHVAHHLGQHRRAVVVGFPAALLVGDDQEDRCAAGILGVGQVVFETVEARHHALQRRFDGQTARFEVENAVEHMRLVGRANAIEGCHIAPGEAVRHPHQLAFKQAGDVAARIVVRGVADAESFGIQQQAVAREVVAQRGVVVLGLGDEIQPAILADAIEAHAAERGHGLMGGFAHRDRGCAGRRSGEARYNTLADVCQEAVETCRVGLREKVNLLFRQSPVGGDVAAIEKCSGFAQRGGVLGAQQIGE